MCGICGVVSLGGAPVAAAELAPMNDALRLRGPDDEGIDVDGTVGLGHRRLSIIDLAGGHQPLSNEDGQVLTILNGEIYNYLSLRERLIALGHVFKTRSDTEVIAHGWEEWGEDVVEHLDGMFALAVWDRRQKKVLLARDRFGKKPLAFFKQGPRFVFASTLTALLRHPSAPRGVDEGALARYLALEFVPQPQTIIGGIQKLEAGTSLLLDVATGHYRKRRFWKLEVKARARPQPEIQVQEEIRERLVEATKKRLMADVPLGVFLSGGIDSSSVVAAAVRAGAWRVKTFSIGFGERSFDETAYAREVARRFDTEHVEEVLDAKDLLAIVPRVGEILDEPMADASIVPTFLLSRIARRHVTVALGGDGGDELFAGYPTYPAHVAAERLGPLRRLAPVGRRLAALLPVSHDNFSFDFKVKKLLLGLDAPPDERNAVWMGATPAALVDELVGAHHDVYAAARARYREGTGSHLEHVLYQDVGLYMCHGVLAKVDRASMAASLEVRAPLLDTAVAEFAGALPIDWKLRRTTGKWILKRVARKLLPEGIVGRPKKGFGMPIARWLRDELGELLRDALLDGSSLAASGALDRAEVARLVDEHARGAIDHRQRLWALVVLELWRRKNLGAVTSAGARRQASIR